MDDYAFGKKYNCHIPLERRQPSIIHTHDPNGHTNSGGWF